MRNCARRLALINAALAFAVVCQFSRTAPLQKPSFEIVSIKPSPPGTLGPRGLIGPRGDRFSMPGATLKMLVRWGYLIQSDAGSGVTQSGQIIGGPSWMDSDRFDVEAKADCSGGPIAYNQMQLMIQALLESRFQLKAHYETREAPVYNLVVAKNGLKMKLSDDQTPTRTPGPPPGALCGPPPSAQIPAPQQGAPFDPRGPLPRGSVRVMGGPASSTISAAAVPISNLVGMLPLERPVIDKTGLTALFDFNLQYAPEDLPNQAAPFGGIPAPPATAAGPAGGTATATFDPLPSIFTAIQEQLGLKLESTKGPVEVLVIESAQKPIDN